jgi:hypothetical protein
VYCLFLNYENTKTFPVGSCQQEVVVSPVNNRWKKNGALFQTKKVPIFSMRLSTRTNNFVVVFFGWVG